MFGVGSPISESRAPSVPPRMSERTGSSPARRIASSAAATTRGCRVDHGAHVPVGVLHLDLDAGPRLALLDRGGEAPHELGVPVEQRVVVVTDDERDDGVLHRGGHARGVDEALAPLGRLGREGALRQRRHELGGELDGVHELALGGARMGTAARGS